jgi:pre-mRNA-splicing factor ATP-dependent RNA helicase DHX38/PRP16
VVNSSEGANCVYVQVLFIYYRINLLDFKCSLTSSCFVDGVGSFFLRVHIGSIGLDMLQVVRISQAQGLQRTGRAGRQGEGHCYRMLTKNVS